MTDRVALTMNDFKMTPVLDADGRALASYYSYTEPGMELCLEPCLNGYDVGFYDGRGNLVTPKVCTEMVLPNIFSQPTKKEMAVALKLANKMYKQKKLYFLT